jgi:hypothetical protein
MNRVRGALQLGWAAIVMALAAGCGGGSDDGATSVPSGAATTAVAPAFAREPSDVAVTAPATATFTATVSGTPLPAVQWQASTDGGASWSDVGGATSTTFSLAATTVAHNDQRFRAIATNSAGSATSRAARLTVQAPLVAPTIAIHPADRTVTEPATATFAVTADGSLPLTYRWQRNLGGSWTDIGGATAATFTTAATSRVGDHGAQFRVAVANAAGSVTSNPATLTVEPAAPIPVVGPAGGTLTFLNGSVRLDFPAGAVAADTMVSVTQVNASARHPAPLGGTLFELQPSMNFAQPVRLTLRFDPAQLAATMDAQTLRVGRSDAQGWVSLDSTVDAVAGTVSADLASFSAYGVIPGLHSWQFGAVPAMAVRYFDWPDLNVASVATDTAGAVYVLGRKPVASSTPPLPTGSFVARLNVDLSVQWLQELPDGTLSTADTVLRVDQSGNVFAGYTVQTATGQAVQLMGYNPNGTARTGFPVRWNLAQFDGVRGMAIDASGNVHVYGRSGALNASIVNGSYAVVRGSDGGFARAPVAVVLPRGPLPTSVEPWDMGLDFAGNVYFTSTWFGNGTPAFGAHVSSFLDTTLGARAGFPVELPSRLVFFVARAVNSKAIAPLQIVPMTGAVGLTSEVNALNVVSGAVQPGFPLALPSAAAISYAAIDASSNTWQLGVARTAQNKNKVWLGSINSSGQMRTDYPRVSGAAADTDEHPWDIAVDPAGTAYVIGRQQQAPGGPYRVFIVRQPAL